MTCEAGSECVNEPRRSLSRNTKHVEGSHFDSDSGKINNHEM